MLSCKSWVSRSWLLYSLRTSLSCLNFPLVSYSCFTLHLGQVPSCKSRGLLSFSFVISPVPTFVFSSLRRPLSDCACTTSLRSNFLCFRNSRRRTVCPFFLFLVSGSFRLFGTLFSCCLCSPSLILIHAPFRPGAIV